MSQIAVFDLTLGLLIVSTLLSLPWRGALRALFPADADLAAQAPRPRPVSPQAHAPHSRHGGHYHLATVQRAPHHHRHTPREHAHQGRDTRP